MVYLAIAVICAVIALEVGLRTKQYNYIQRKEIDQIRAMRGVVMDIQKQHEDFDLWWEGNAIAMMCEEDEALKIWQAAKAQAVPEGFVLVPKENISYFWQDNDEPENFCSNESDFDCLGDCIDLGEIMEINKFTQAHVNKEILFGTWFAEAIDPSEKANFFVGTHAECLEIVAKNKAMIEAQEQK